MDDLAANMAIAPDFRAYLWAFLLIVVVPLLTTVIVGFWFAKSLPAAALLIVGLTCGAIFAWVVHSAMRAEISMNTSELRISGGLFRRSANLVDIDWTQSREVDLKLMPQFRLGWKLFGIGLPGYQSGLYTLQSGKRVFVLITGAPLVYISVNRGEDMLLSVTPASALLSRVRSGQ